MVGDHWSTNPAAQLRIAFAKVARDPMSVEAEDAGAVAQCDANVARAVLLVEGTRKGVNDAVHDRVPTLTGVSVVFSPTHLPNRSCSHRIFDSW